MGTLPRARALERGRKAEMPAGLETGRRILPPAALVEIDREEPAGLVRQKRIDSGDEGIAAGVDTRQMLADHIVGERKKATADAFGALDARLLADAADPFVGAGRRIAVPARPAILEPPRVDILPPAKQRTEQPDLCLDRGAAIDRGDLVHHATGSVQPLVGASPTPVERPPAPQRAGSRRADCEHGAPKSPADATAPCAAIVLSPQRGGRDRGQAARVA